jgi:hypothetical protein
MAAEELGHGLVDRDPHGAEVRARQPGAAPVDRQRGPFHLLDVVQQLERLFGRLEAVRQPVEQPGAELLLERLDAP